LSFFYEKIIKLFDYLRSKCYLCSQITNKMEFQAQQIAEYLDGTVEGNPQAAVQTFAKIEEGMPGAISFLANPKYAHYLYETESSIVLINQDYQLEKPVKTTLIRVANAYEAIARLLTLYESMTQRRKGIHPLAFISETAVVADDVYVGAFAYIGDGVKIGAGTQIYPHVVVEERATIGENCILYPNVSVYHDCKLGNRIILHSGVVIGADGFGFAPAEDGYEKIPQIGIVTIEDDVELGANTCIDRSTMGSTYIRKGVKLDNLVQIGHNCDIRSNTVISAQSGVAGSTKVGEWCMFGGQVGIAGHIEVANRTHLGAQTGLISNKKEGVTLMGSPAIDAKQFMLASAYFKRLPDLAAEVKARQFTDDALTSEGVKRERKDNALEASINAEIAKRTSEDTRVLKEAKEYADHIGEHALHYCGQVDKVSDLAFIRNPKVGDMYNVKENGANYAWNGIEWDKLSETIDLTPFLKKEEFNVYLAQLQAADATNAAAIEAETTARTNALQVETNARTNADATLQSNLTVEVNARTAADTSLGQRIDAESSIRSDADTNLGNRITGETEERTAAITKEIQDRGTADNLIYEKIELEKQQSVARDNTLTTNLSGEVALRTSEDVRVLAEAKEYADTVGAKAMHFKGSVANRAALEAITDMKQGDMYNVEEYKFDDGHTVKGANFAWTGVRWDKLSENIDLTPYAKTADMVAADNALGTRITNNTTAITAAAAVADSAKSLATTAKSIADTNAAAIEAEVTRAKAKENANTQAIADEALRAKGIEGGLRTDITALQSGLTAEQGLRASEDARVLKEAKEYCDSKESTLEERVNVLSATVASQAETIAFWSEKIDANERNITSEIARAKAKEGELLTAIGAEEDAREQADEALGTRIGNEETARANAITNLISGSTVISKLLFSSDEDPTHNYQLKVVLVDDGKGGVEPSLQLVEVAK